MKKTSLMKYNEIMANCDPETDLVERLRIFLCIALDGDDWLDVEPFLEDISKKIAMCESLSDEWLNKTEVVQEWVSKGILSGRYLGVHRADILVTLARKYLDFENCLRRDYD